MFFKNPENEPPEQYFWGTKIAVPAFMVAWFLLVTLIVAFSFHGVTPWVVLLLVGFLASFGVWGYAVNRWGDLKDGKRHPKQVEKQSDDEGHLALHANIVATLPESIRYSFTAPPIEHLHGDALALPDIRVDDKCYHGHVASSLSDYCLRCGTVLYDY